MFRSQYCNKSLKIGLDYSNEWIDDFVEIPPYTFDKESGQALNKTPFPILKKVGRINIQEQIQSYADECDFYRILTRFAQGDCSDMSIINRGVVAFGDIAELPDNINDYNKYMQAYFDKIGHIDKDIAYGILEKKFSNDVIVKMIDERIKAQMIKKDGE